MTKHLETKRKFGLDLLIKKQLPLVRIALPTHPSANAGGSSAARKTWGGYPRRQHSMPLPQRPSGISGAPEVPE